MLREAGRWWRPSRLFAAIGTGPWAEALILTLVVAATGSTVFLGFRLQIGNASSAPVSELDQGRLLEAEALIASSRQALGRCTSGFAQIYAQPSSAQQVARKKP
jgi:hypothetical protein